MLFYTTFDEVKNYNKAICKTKTANIITYYNIPCFLGIFLNLQFQKFDNTKIYIPTLKILGIRHDDCAFSNMKK